MGLRPAVHYDPFAVFSESKTPPGLYARRRWLKESSRAWETDFRETVRLLRAGQKRNGSWNNSPLETIRRLFGLHLTVRDPDDSIERALDWLAERIGAVPGKKRVFSGATIGNKKLGGLPFTSESGLFFLEGATLFLATIFGRDKDPFLLSLYNWLDDLGTKRRGKWCGWSCSNNILRAFVVHPIYAQKQSVSIAVKALGAVQEKSGRWPRPVPFYQTVNALAHLESGQGDIQLQRAFQWLTRIQNRNGTWGRTDTEWKSFLVIHAMKNKNML